MAQAACAALVLAAALAIPMAVRAADGVAGFVGATGGADLLSVDQAMRLSARATAPDRVELTWAIADDVYVYREKLKFVLDTSTGVQAGLGAASLPLGKEHTDDYFGTQQVYYGELRATLPVARAPGGALELPLKVTFQGCNGKIGLCYPPETKSITVQLPPATTASVVDAAPADGSGGYVSEQDRLASLLRSGNLFAVLGTFFVIGLGLAFTPCVLPMVPILSGLIAGQGANVTARRAFSLSLAYVLGMALTYTVAGAAFAAAGQQVQALFQKPWIIATFAGLFVVMAVSMFGAFTLQMPAAIQTRLSALSNRQRAGSYGGVAMMGALSALIVTACVAPALVAALSVIGQTGDVARGAAGLFVMALGMGVPLLVVGTSAGRFLPRAGMWMDTVKQVFAALMLGLAAWMLARIVPPAVGMLLWAVPAVALAIVLRRAAARRSAGWWALRAVSTAAALYAIFLAVGAVRGAHDPLRPLQVTAKVEELPFVTIKSVADLQREVDGARRAGRPVMLDFYADWCVSCKEMEKYTFPDPAVRGALGDTLLLRADVTANDAEDKALLKHFGIFGPPTIAFYGSNGAELGNFRVVGYMKAAEFAGVLQQAIGARSAGVPTPVAAKVQ